MTNNCFDLLIIGGGASGLMAAIAAARAGVRPLVLERMDRVGKKLLVTGNGRCNLTNREVGPEHFHGSDPGFVAASLRRFGIGDTLRFFEDLGLLWKTEDEGRVFPRTGQASAVLDLLRDELKRLGVEEFCDSEAARIERTDAGFHVILKNGRELDSRAVILAAGGRAAPSLGSNGSGYFLARNLGHDVIEPMPAVVQIRLDSPFLKRIKGVKVEGGLSLENGGSIVESASGEILFTEYGVSGPPALRLSRKVNELLRENGRPIIGMDFFPDRSSDELLRDLEARLKTLSGKEAVDGLVGMIHKRLIPVMLETARIDKDKPCGAFSWEETHRLASVLKGWKFPSPGTRSWNEAQVTAGGVATKDIDPETLESKIVPGLYFCGEVLDVDGDSGGYNLQWTWSSGFTAGTSAALNLNRRSILKNGRLGSSS